MTGMLPRLIALASLLGISLNIDAGESAANAPSEVISPTVLDQNPLSITKREAAVSAAVGAKPHSPRQKYVTAQTNDARAAYYFVIWLKRVERAGELNFPAGLSGSLRIRVTVNPEGELVETEILRSSGNRRLDAAAKRIAMLAAPYAKPSAGLLDGNDLLSIIATWRFTRSSGKLDGTCSEDASASDCDLGKSP